MSTPAAGQAGLQSLRVTCAAVITTPLVILLALVFLLQDSSTGSPPAWALAVPVVQAAVVALVVSTVGYRTVAIAPGTREEEARRTSLSAFTATTLVRLVLPESVAIVAVALAFVVEEGGLLVYVVGMVLGMVLMIWFGWPGERSITRVQESLEREGARSHLREALGTT